MNSVGSDLIPSRGLGSEGERHGRSPRRRHRSRLGRPLYGRPAEEGRRRGFRDPREGQRRRRHLVPQPLPGRGVRRAVAPLLLLLRAQPDVVAPLRRAGRDPRLPEPHRRQIRPAPPHPPRDRSRRRDLARRRQPLGDPHEGRRDAALEGRNQRPRDVQQPGVARHPGYRGLRGRLLPLRAVEPRSRLTRKARGRDRNRGERDPVRARDRPRRGEPPPVPAHGQLGGSQAERPLHTGAARPLPRQPAGAPTQPRRDLRHLEYALHLQGQGGPRGDREGRPRAHRRGPRPGGAAQAHPRPSLRPAGGRSFPTSTTRSSTATTSSFSPRRSCGSRRPEWRR